VKPSKEKLLTLLKEGIVLKNLGIRFGVHYRTVRDWCKEYGIEDHIVKCDRKWGDL
jgi:hypothetical protein